MAKLICRLEKTSLEDMLIFAACVKWDVEEDYFHSKGKKSCPERENDKRRIVHWLMWKDCGMNYSEIGKKFGFSKQGMKEGIEKLDFLRRIYLSISQDIEDIRYKAGKLQITLSGELEFSAKVILSNDSISE